MILRKKLIDNSEQYSFMSSWSINVLCERKGMSHQHRSETAMCYLYKKHYLIIRYKRLNNSEWTSFNGTEKYQMRYLLWYHIYERYHRGPGFWKRLSQTNCWSNNCWNKHEVNGRSVKFNHVCDTRRRYDIINWLLCLKNTNEVSQE